MGKFKGLEDFVDRHGEQVLKTSRYLGYAAEGAGASWCLYCGFNGDVDGALAAVAVAYCGSLWHRLMKLSISVYGLDEGGEASH